IELAVDDAPIVARLEGHAGILPPLRMRQPPRTDINPLGFFLTGHDVTVEIEVAEGPEAQVRRHAIGVALATGRMLHFLEAQHPSLATVEHDAIVRIEFGQQSRGFVIRHRGRAQLSQWLSVSATTSPHLERRRSRPATSPPLASTAPLAVETRWSTSSSPT